MKKHFIAFGCLIVLFFISIIVKLYVKDSNDDYAAIAIVNKTDTIKFKSKAINDLFKDCVWDTIPLASNKVEVSYMVNTGKFSKETISDVKLVRWAKILMPANSDGDASYYLYIDVITSYSSYNNKPNGKSLTYYISWADSQLTDKNILNGKYWLFKTANYEPAKVELIFK